MKWNGVAVIEVATILPLRVTGGAQVFLAEEVLVLLLLQAQQCGNEGKLSDFRSKWDPGSDRKFLQFFEGADT